MTQILRDSDSGELEFDFSQANSARVFDDSSHGMSHCLKAVDFIVEWQHEVWWIEVKDPENSAIPAQYQPQNLLKFLEKMRSKTLLTEELVPKIKDTFLYLYLMGQLPLKPIKFFAVLGIDNNTIATTLLLPLTDQLKKYLCLPSQNTPWQKPFIIDAMIFNLTSWNTHNPHCPVQRKP